MPFPHLCLFLFDSFPLRDFLLQHRLSPGHLCGESGVGGGAGRGGGERRRQARALRETQETCGQRAVPGARSCLVLWNHTIRHKGSQALPEQGSQVWVQEGEKQGCSLALPVLTTMAPHPITSPNAVSPLSSSLWEGVEEVKSLLP